MRIASDILLENWVPAAFTIICFILVYQILLGQKHLPHPPGPKGLPFVGNISDIPENNMHLWAAEQAKVYGDLAFYSILGKGFLFVNSYSDAIELLEKRSIKYSSRPRNIYKRDLEGWDWFLAFMPYGDRYKKHRAVVHRFTQTSALPNYMAVQTHEVHTLLKNILNNPRDYDKHIQRFPGAVILRIVYGHKVVDDNDPLVTLSEAGIQSTGSTEVHMVEFMPWLKYIPGWLPGAYFKERAKEGLAISSAVLKKPYEDAKKRHVKGISCVVSELIQENTDEDGNIKDEDVIAASAGMLYGAGQDTITTTLMIAVLALTLYPDVQLKAQSELDRVIGKDTLPSFDDKTRLPYVNAICAEVLRWIVVTPLSVPHSTTSNDEYKGCFIPAGTVVFPNVWSMTRDKNLYSNPEKFDPERYLPSKGQAPEMHPENFAFGFGRRFCQGSEIAQNAVFLAISSLLASFNISKAVDEKGNPVEPTANFKPKSFLTVIDRFECSITPRSTKVAETIRQLVE